MKRKKLFLDELTKEFIFEIYDRTENDQPDESLEYSESVEMTAYELAEQLVEGNVEEGHELTTISIGRSAQDFLKKVYKNSLENDGRLFQSLELSMDMEAFLYGLGKYLKTGNLKEPFDF